MRDVHVVVIQDGPMQALGSKAVKDPTSLKCELCNKTFSRSWLLKNHQRVHTGERPYKCAFCEKAFADKSNLRQHQKIHTTTEKLFQCGICQRTFAQRRYLMKHATEIHREVSVSLCGAIKKEKEELQEKFVAEKVSVVQTAPEIPDKSADHQYLTRHKSRSKSVPESKEETEVKDKKYSEQDLKDFIKSNQKTMEKNGYIFIKQNFESLDTEPTLTEISEVPVTTIKDEVALKTEPETGNQILNVNGKMVYLQMENKVVPSKALPQSIPVLTQNTPEPVAQSGTANILKGRKLVAKKDTGVRKQANILKTSGVRRTHEGVAQMGGVKFVNVANPKHITKPVQMFQVPQNIPAEPLTLVQVTPQGTISMMPNQGQFMVPMSVVQMPQHGQPILVAPNSTNLKTVTLPSINNLSVNNTIVNRLPETDIIAGTNPQQIIEIKTDNQTATISHVKTVPTSGIQILPVTKNQAVPASDIQIVPVTESQMVPVSETHNVSLSIDEKGAASNISGSQAVISTPIVTDAPWQGIVNINSEQELYEYINSQSALDHDNGMTILIQNVDSQNGTVMSLDSHNLLSGSGNFSNVFHDQSIVSDVLPDSVNITEVQIGSDESLSQNSNQNDVGNVCEIKDNFLAEEIVHEEENNLVMIKEASNDSDDAQSQVMLTEANREHLSDQEDFTDDHSEKVLDDQGEKMLVKNDNECEVEGFSDHSMYTAHEDVKCDLDERPEHLMETDECESGQMIIDDPNNIDGNLQSDHPTLQDGET